jgi:serine/threonine-protein kinase
VIATGVVLAGKYQIEGVMGVGGMGVVLAATHLELGRSICLKFLLPRLAQAPTARARFLREARIASALRDHRFCRIHDVAETDDGTPYIVMERIDGHDLGVEVARRGPLSVDEGVALVSELCAAMSEAHALGIVHRDLKPENVLLTRRLDGTPFPKIVDFGISRSLDAATTTGAGGSPGFMAPEQLLAGAAVDPRADVYSLGALLYLLVAGRPPFVAADAVHLAVLQQSTVPAPPSRWRPEIDAALDAVILRCLDRRPERRPAHAAALAAALADRRRRPGRRRAGIGFLGVAAAALAGGLVIATSIPAGDAIATRETARRPHVTMPPDSPRLVSTSAPSPAIATPAVPVTAAPAQARPVREDTTKRPHARHSQPSASPAPTTAVDVAAPAPDVVSTRSRCRTDDFLCEFGSKTR